MNFFFFLSRVPQRDNEDSEEPDKAVEEVNNTETMQETFACKLCLEQFPDRSKVQAHMVKCVTIHITPSKKRGKYSENFNCRLLKLQFTKMTVFFCSKFNR